MLGNVGANIGGFVTVTGDGFDAVEEDVRLTVISLKYLFKENGKSVLRHSLHSTYLAN